ncbi:MAG: sialidase family protein [Planctomycetia bacterium]|nr:sialidase family protein [Planctomycetia bacterium]
MKQDEPLRICVMAFLTGYIALVMSLALSDEKKPEVLGPKKTPLIAKSIVLDLPPSQDNPRNSEGDFIRLVSGDILYIYTHYYGDSGDDHASACLMSRISKDHGQTWSEEDELVLENEGRMNVMSVSLVRLRDRSIALFYLVKEDAGDCRPYLRYSYDEGKTWTERIETISARSYNVVNNSRVLHLPEGRLLIPVARHNFKGGDVYNYESKATLFCLYSDDGGRRWKQSDDVPNINNIMYQEPGVVELSDGRLLMTIRNASGRQYYSYSRDRGVTWSDSEPSPLVSPASPAAIIRAYNSDKLIAVWNDSNSERNPLTIGLLSPDGKTILAKKTLDYAGSDEPRAFCYPALFYVDQDSLLVGYCAGRAPYGLNAARIALVNLKDLSKEL